jgi:hypothetical protein
LFISFCATRCTIAWHFSVPFIVCHFAEICRHSGSSVEQNDFMAGIFQQNEAVVVPFPHKMNVLFCHPE